MSVPGFPRGRTASIVELVDLYPTLSELAGLQTPEQAQGISLVPLLRDHDATVKNGAISFNKGFSWRTPKWHYMRYTDDTRELYDMDADPHEFTNLAGDEAYAPVVKKLDANLQQRLQSAKIKL